MNTLLLMRSLDLMLFLASMYNVLNVLFFVTVCVWCFFFFFFSSRRRHTRWTGDWSSDVCSSDLLAAQRYAQLPALLRRAAATLAGWVPDALGNGLTIDRMKRFLCTGDGGTADRYFDLQLRAGDALRQQLYAPALRSVTTEHAERERFRHLDGNGGARRGLAAALYLDYKTYLADDILALSDRLSMAHSLEIRVPLVDHELVEQVFPLPADLKVGRWELKRLLKRA